MKATIVLDDEMLQKALSQLNNGISPEEALKRLAHTFTNKLIHTPAFKFAKQELTSGMI